MDPLASRHLEWFDRNYRTLEASYLAASEPWRQSGFSGSLERWNACRRPIADCMDRDGTFLDIGCANGLLLESVVSWMTERGVRVDPFGLDMSAALVALAERRVPALVGRLFVGNAFTWQPPRRFDFVRTELCYVPDDLRWVYVRRLLDEYLSPGGRLLVAEYRSRRDDSACSWVDDELRAAGFAVSSTASGFWEDKELTRVAVTAKVCEDVE